jgi:hypothetical protein
MSNQKVGAAGFGPRCCMAWTSQYTRRLPPQIAADRRAEIASDLFEHGHDSIRSKSTSMRHNLEVLGRVLVGIPHDLSWRREVLRSQSYSLSGGRTIMRRLVAAADHAVVIFASLGIGVATMLVPLLGPALVGGPSKSEVFWLLGTGALALLLSLGLSLRIRQKRSILATVLLVLGSPAPSLALFWLPPLYLLTVAIFFSALASTHRQPPPPLLNALPPQALRPM